MKDSETLAAGGTAWGDQQQRLMWERHVSDWLTEPRGAYLHPKGLGIGPTNIRHGFDNNGTWSDILHPSRGDDAGQRRTMELLALNLLYATGQWSLPPKITGATWTATHVDLSVQVGTGNKLETDVTRGKTAAPAQAWRATVAGFEARRGSIWAPATNVAITDNGATSGVATVRITAAFADGDRVTYLTGGRTGQYDGALDGKDGYAYHHMSVTASGLAVPVPVAPTGRATAAAYLTASNIGAGSGGGDTPQEPSAPPPAMGATGQKFTGDAAIKAGYSHAPTWPAAGPRKGVLALCPVKSTGGGISSTLTAGGAAMSKLLQYGSAAENALTLGLHAAPIPASGTLDVALTTDSHTGCFPITLYLEGVDISTARVTRQPANVAENPHPLTLPAQTKAGIFVVAWVGGNAAPASEMQVTTTVGTVLHTQQLLAADGTPQIQGLLSAIEVPAGTSATVNITQPSGSGIFDVAAGVFVEQA